MSMMTAQTRSDIFAANRAVGHVGLDVASSEGRTRRVRVAEQGSLRVRFPGPPADDLTAVIVNTAGGIASGDRFGLDVKVGETARLTVTTTAAEKVYRSLGPDADIRVHLTIAADASLLWLPQETIVFDQSRLARTIDVEMADSATLVLVEILVFGRAAMGETMRHGTVFDRWRVRRDNRLVLAESLRLDGAIADQLTAPAVAAGGAAVATLLAVPCDEAKVAAVRARDDWQGEAAISAWNGLAVGRFVANDGAPLRHDVITMLGALGVPLPRSWLN
jgi:urease accessory protein